VGSPEGRKPFYRIFGWWEWSTTWLFRKENATRCVLAPYHE